jgi:hypothetical protein
VIQVRSTSAVYLSDSAGSYDTVQTVAVSAGWWTVTSYKTVVDFYSGDFIRCRLAANAAASVGANRPFRAPPQVGRRRPGSTQQCHVINSAYFFPSMLAVSVVLLAGGVAALRSGALPRWLAWVAAVVGAVAVLGPLGFAAFFLMPVWSLVVGVILNRRAATPSVSPAHALS